MSLGRVGIILSGGGFACSFQVGVVKYLWEKEIIPEKIQGVSGGALNAAKIVESGPDILEKVWLEIEKKGPALIFSNWKAAVNIVFNQSSIFSDKGLNFLVSNLDIERIVNSEIELEIVVRNESLNKIEIINNHNFKNADDKETLRKFIKASASISGFFPPVAINNLIYSDGYYFMLDPSFAEFNVVFIIQGVQYFANEEIADITWRKKLMRGFHFILDECLEEKIKTFVKEHKFQLPLQENNSWPVLKHIQELFKNLIGLPSKKLIIITPEKLPSTLMLNNFKKGDIKKAIDEGYQIAEKKILNFK